MPKTKSVKRQEAIERQAEYEKLTAKQKLEKLDKKGCVAKKQRERINKNG